MCEKYSPKVWVKDPGRWFGPTCRSRSDRVPTEATGMMSGWCDGCRQIGKCRLSDSWFAASDWRLYEPSEAQRAAAVSWRANRQMLGLKRALLLRVHVHDRCSKPSSLCAFCLSSRLVLRITVCRRECFECVSKSFWLLTQLLRDQS